MKTIKIVKIPAKPAQPARTEEVRVYTCDFCKEVIDKSLDNRYGSGESACQVCSRDVCRKCLIVEHDWTDDPAGHYCRLCHYLWFTTYMKDRQDIEEKCAKEIAKLDKKIKKESLSATTTTV